MKKTGKVLLAGIFSVSMLAGMSTNVFAEDEYIYGTMDIPYDLFYAGEKADAENDYDVDAVSSATDAKWSKNGEGELFEGTYHSEANADGSGKILGVTYPVAITQADLDALGDDNFNFTELDSAPAAYKTVTVEDGNAVFSAVEDGSPENAEGNASINANSVWGDYQLSIEGFPEDIGAVYGAFITTTDNNVYVMRHEQNIWRQGELAWSVGYTVEEPHGNKLEFDIFADSQGKTIDKITYITKNGYLTYDVDVYIPIKFEHTAEIANAPAGSGSTEINLEGFPEDYSISYEIDGLDFSVDADTLTYENAAAGGYSGTISDESGVYQDIPVSFEITTEDIPAKYDNDAKAITAADGFSADDLANYIKNISSVSVDGTSYEAVGKHGLVIIKEDGTIDTAAEGRDGKAFADGKDSYEITVTALGFTNDLTFTLSNSDDSEAPAAVSEVPSDETQVQSAVNAPASDSPGSNPGTGNSAAVLGALFVLGGAAAAVSKKKK